MEIQRLILEIDGLSIPSIAIIPSNPVGAAVIVHGYGGSKEEQLGLAWRVAESGLAIYAIDLRGHGQNNLPLDEKVILDVKAAIRYCRSFGKVVAIGHSLGGRLAMVSDADYAIGISPALNTVFENQARENLKNLRKYRVRDSHEEDFLEVFRNIPIWKSSQDKPILIIYGERDIPEIISLCNKIEDVPAFKVEKALHSDIF